MAVAGAPLPGSAFEFDAPSPHAAVARWSATVCDPDLPRSFMSVSDTELMVAFDGIADRSNRIRARRAKPEVPSLFLPAKIHEPAPLLSAPFS